MSQLEEYSGPLKGSRYKLRRNKEIKDVVVHASLETSLNSYPMSTKCNGLALIISCVNFSSVKNYRTGGEYEVDNVINTFQQLRYFVSVHNDLTREQFVKLLTYVGTDKEMGKFSSLVLIIMSHGVLVGRRGSVCLSDELPVNIEWILATLSESMCEAFQGKPKIIINASCR